MLARRSVTKCLQIKLSHLQRLVRPGFDSKGLRFFCQYQLYGFCFGYLVTHTLILHLPTDAKCDNWKLCKETSTYCTQYCLQIGKVKRSAKHFLASNGIIYLTCKNLRIFTANNESIPLSVFKDNYDNLLFLTPQGKSLFASLPKSSLCN